MKFQFIFILSILSLLPFFAEAVISSGENVVVMEPVPEDFITFGQSVNVLAPVSGDVIIFAESITIDSTIAQDCTVFGKEVVLKENAVIEGNLRVFAERVTVDGKILGDADITAEYADVHGTINGNLYHEVSELHIADDAVIGGIVTSEHLSENNGFPLISKLITALIIFIIGAVGFALFGKRLQKCIRYLHGHPFKSMGLGLVAYLALLATCVLFFVSILGIPLALIILLGIGVLTFFAEAVVAYYVGQRVIRFMGRKCPVYGTLALGVVIWVLLASIPIVGILVTIASWFAGLGVVTACIMNKV